MARSNHALAFKIDRQAEVFAALGDPIRLSIVTTLNDRRPKSISTLTDGTKISRQAVTKHLTVLEDVGLVTKFKDGRETLYELDAAPLKNLQEHLAIISQQWDQALNNLKNFVEEKE